MDDELLKKISKEGNLHPSNKVMDILRKVVRATKEEDAKICESESLTYTIGSDEECGWEMAIEECASSIRASK